MSPYADLFRLPSLRVNAVPNDPVNRGFVLPPMTPAVSRAAPILRAAAIEANPSSHEIRVKPRAVADQQDLPCCVSCALGSAMETLDSGWPALAPLFHYHVTRYDRAGADASGFLYLESGLTTVTVDGICRQELHVASFTEAGGASQPTPDAYADAAARALGRRNLRVRYAQADGLSKAAWIRDQIAQDRPVVIGFQLPVGYHDRFLNSSFEWLDPDRPPRSASGHCVLVTGYNDLRQAIRIQDCQGPQRFDGGCWWMGYRVVDSTAVTDVYSLIP